MRLPRAWARGLAAWRRDLWERDLDDAGRLERVLLTVARMAVVVRRGFTRHQLTMRSGSLTYITIFSFVPTLAVAFAMFKAFGGLEGAQSVLLPKLLSYLAVGVREEVQGRLREMLANVHTGAIGATGFLFLAVAAVALLSSIQEALDDVWGVRAHRTTLQRMAVYWAVVTIAPILLLLGVSLPAMVDRFLPLGWVMRHGGDVVLSTVLPIVVVSSAFALMYRFMTEARVTPSAAVVGGIAGGVVWSCAAWLYSWYARTTVYYANIYGSLSAIPIFIFWIYLSWFILLMGALVAFAWQNLATHRQEVLAEAASRRARELAALRVHVEVVRGFLDAGPPVAAAALPERLGLSGRLVNETVEALSEIGWLLPGAPDHHLLPARDPTTTTPADLLAALRTQGEADVWRGQDAVTERLAHCQEAEEDAVAQVWRETTFAALARDGASVNGGPA